MVQFQIKIDLKSLPAFPVHRVSMGTRKSSWENEGGWCHIDHIMHQVTIDL